jgi:hypothetical protein
LLARPGLSNGAPLETHTLHHNVATPRPGGNEVSLDLALEGTPCTTLSLGQDSSTYSAPLPWTPSDDGTVKLTLKTECWNPQAAGVSQDSRDLGVMLDWVELVGE